MSETEDRTADARGAVPEFNQPRCKRVWESLDGGRSWRAVAKPLDEEKPPS